MVGGGVNAQQLYDYLYLGKSPEQPADEAENSELNKTNQEEGTQSGTALDNKANTEEISNQELSETVSSSDKTKLILQNNLRRLQISLSKMLVPEMRVSKLMLKSKKIKKKP